MTEGVPTNGYLPLRNEITPSQLGSLWDGVISFLLSKELLYLSLLLQARTRVMIPMMTIV